MKHKKLFVILFFQNSNTELATSKITEFKSSASGENSHPHHLFLTPQ
jgi:hypothetical protein